MKIKRIAAVLLSAVTLISMSRATFAAETEEETPIKITLDAGHGYNKREGCYTGAAQAMQWGGLQEDFYNWDITLACKERLEQYGIEVHMTKRDLDDNPSYDRRVMTAVNNGSIAFISIHNNAYSDPSVSGSNIFLVNPNYNPQMYKNSVAMANCVMKRLVRDAGTTQQTPPYYSNNPDTKLPDGSDGEKFNVLYHSKCWSAGKYDGSNIAAAMIVECVFQTCEYDVKNFLMNPEKIKAMGVAIADGIAEYYDVELPVETEPVTEAVTDAPTEAVTDTAVTEPATSDNGTLKGILTGLAIGVPAAAIVVAAVLFIGKKKESKPKE